MTHHPLTELLMEVWTHLWDLLKFKNSAATVGMCVMMIQCVPTLGLTWQTRGPGEGQAARLAGDGGWWLGGGGWWCLACRGSTHIQGTVSNTHTAAASYTPNVMWQVCLRTLSPANREFLYLFSMDDSRSLKLWTFSQVASEPQVLLKHCIFFVKT